MEPTKKLTKKEKIKKSLEKQVKKGTTWVPHTRPFGLSEPKPLYPYDKISWEEFQKMEKDAGYEHEEFQDKIQRLSREGILNLDIESLRGTPEYEKVKNLIKSVKKEFNRVHHEPMFSNTTMIIGYIISILGILTGIVGMTLENSQPKDLKLMRQKEPQKYLKILQKNKKLRDMITSLKVKPTPQKTLDFAKDFIKLLEK